MNSGSETAESPDVRLGGKHYTGARKFQKYVGRFLDGTKIPGGPYKIVQAVVGGSVLILTLISYSLHLWGTRQLIVDVIIGGSVVFGSFWASGFIPVTKRNLIRAAGSILKAMTARAAGHYRGSSIAIKKPHGSSFGLRRQSITTTLTTTAIAEPSSEGLVELARTPSHEELVELGEPAPTPPPTVVAIPALTGVQRLLLQATQSTNGAS